MTQHTHNYKKARQGLFERKAILALLVVCFVMGGLYVYSLGSVVFAVVERRADEKRVETLRGDIAILEVNYLSAASDLTFDKAVAVGLEKPTEIAFKERGLFTAEAPRHKLNEF